LAQTVRDTFKAKNYELNLLQVLHKKEIGTVYVTYYQSIIRPRNSSTAVLILSCNSSHVAAYESTREGR